MTRIKILQQMGGSTQFFSIEDEGGASEASSRQVGGTSRDELAVGLARLIIDPESEYNVDLNLECWWAGNLKAKGCSLNHLKSDAARKKRMRQRAAPITKFVSVVT